MYKSIDDVASYADCFGIPRHISVPFVRDFDKWVRNSGEEWTVSRIKSIKLDFIRHKAGLEMCSTWIRKNSHGSFYGSVGGLFNFCFSKRKNFSKTVQLLDIYTTLISKEITTSQRKKFLDGVQSSPVDIPVCIRTGVVQGLKELHLKRTWISDPKPLGCCIPSPSTKQPLPNGKSIPDDVGYLPSVSYVTDTHLGIGLRESFPRIFRPLLDGIDIKFTYHNVVHLLKQKGPLYEDSVGKIGVIQEPGFKLRAVANPARIYQTALKPLGDYLYDIIRDLPWDCTHDQAMPFRYIQDHLRLNHTCYSVDLSGATDYFPLDLQMEVIRYLSIRTDYPDLFEALSRAPWQFEKGTIRWTKGQPLGLQPSFASFTLTHGLLLFYLNNFKHDNKFFVVGDDVIILDDALNTKYRICLQTLGCPTSDLKSIASRKMAEFAGKIITVDEVIPQLKWRDPSDNSFIDLVRNIGPRSLRILKPRQRKVAKVLMDIPDFLGGIGFNPKGLPLEVRYEKYLTIFGSDKTAQYLMSYNELLNRHNYYDDFDNFSKRFSYEPISDLDQRSYSLALKLLPNLISWYTILGKNLYTIDNGLPLQIASGSKRFTRLETLERAIGI